MNVDGRATHKQSRLDIQIQSLPQVLQNLIQSKQFTVIGELGQQSATMKFQIAGRGELVAQATLQGSQKAVVKIFDQGLVSTFLRSMNNNGYFECERVYSLYNFYLDKSSKPFPEKTKSILLNRKQKVFRTVTFFYTYRTVYVVFSFDSSR